MALENRRFLSLAVRNGQVCVLFFVGRDLYDWRAASKPVRRPEAMMAQLRHWLDLYRPEVIISENPASAKLKGKKSIAALQTIARMAEDHPALNMIVTRKLTFSNLYEEAAALAKRYPLLQSSCPKKPPIWHSEARNLVYFEALAMALDVVNGSGDHDTLC